MATPLSAASRLLYQEAEHSVSSNKIYFFILAVNIIHFSLLIYVLCVRVCVHTLMGTFFRDTRYSFHQAHCTKTVFILVMLTSAELQITSIEKPKSYQYCVINVSKRSLSKP